MGEHELKAMHSLPPPTKESPCESSAMGRRKLSGRKNPVRTEILENTHRLPFPTFPVYFPAL